MEEKKLHIGEGKREAGTAPTNLRAVLKGDTVSTEVANAISEALGYKTEQLFSLSKDSSPLSSKTVIEYHRLISSILRMAEKEMIVPYNAAEKATPPRNDRTEAACFQPNEILEILDCLQDEPIRWRTITHMLIITGCRRGEIMGLHWSDIDWDNNQICVRRNLLYTAKTGVYEDSTKTRTTRYVKLPLSSAITLPDKLRNDIGGYDQGKAISNIENMMSDDVKGVPLYDALMQHRKEYIISVRTTTGLQEAPTMPMPNSARQRELPLSR